MQAMKENTNIDTTFCSKVGYYVVCWCVVWCNWMWSDVIGCDVVWHDRCDVMGYGEVWYDVGSAL